MLERLTRPLNTACVARLNQSRKTELFLAHEAIMYVPDSTKIPSYVLAVRCCSWECCP